MKKYNKLKLQNNIIYDDDTDTDTDTDDDNSLQEDIVQKLVKDDDIDNYTEIINKLKPFTKNHDGTYTIGNKVFNTLYGSRQDVWDGKAYQTTGKLIKQELTIGKYGKIISKTKSIQSFITNNLFKNNSTPTDQ
jgi:hypothetical protein